MPAKSCSLKAKHDAVLVGLLLAEMQALRAQLERFGKLLDELVTKFGSGG